MRNLNLARPLAFVDLETTGLDIFRDRIIEIAILKAFPDGKEEIRTRRLNPGMAIPEKSTQFHGIKDVDVAGKPTFEMVAQSLFKYLDGCDFSGYNLIRFDLPFLSAEFARCGLNFAWADRKVIDTMVIYHQKDPRNLAAATRKYCGHDLEGAHGAEADVKAAARVLEGQLSIHKDIPKTVQGLNAMCRFLEGK